MGSSREGMEATCAALVYVEGIQTLDEAGRLRIQEARLWPENGAG
jgi:hypothetical protein